MANRGARRQSLAGLALVGALVLGCGGARPRDCSAPAGCPSTEWPSYGNDAGGSRFAAVGDVTPENVHCLERAWTYHTGDLPDSRGAHRSELASEVTPILVDGSLLLCTPYNRVIALDPETGTERWAFDPELDLSGKYANQLVCRGVSSWLDAEAPPGARCRRRIFTATNDARLFALYAADGRPCPGFGAGGSVDLNPDVGPQDWRGEYQVTSPPAITRDAVIVGAAISDNQRTDAPSGVVRAYDARTGALRWAWDLRPPGFVATPANTSAAGYALATPNVWAPMAVDLARDLVFVPTGNPAPDYYRGDSNLDHYGSSVVALRASSGEVAWRFQTVHRDLWDYDVPAQPTLFTWRSDGREIPALVQATKMGLLFVLNRETGEPLFPVEERPVPHIAVPGERLSPTQPFPTRPPGLARASLAASDAFGFTPWDRGACRRRFEQLRFEGIYTPPTTQGTLMLPGNAGGSNWGGVAVDEARQRLVANTQNLAWAVQLVPRVSVDAERARGDRSEYSEYAPMRGTPYVMQADSAHLTPRRTLQPAALGPAGRGRPRERGALLAGDARDGPGLLARAAAAPARHADARGSATHRERARLHRRDDGLGSARLRCGLGRGALERAAPDRRDGDADDVPRGRPAVRGDRRDGLRPRRRARARRARRVRAAARALSAPGFSRSAASPRRGGGRTPGGARRACFASMRRYRGQRLARGACDVCQGLSPLADSAPPRLLATPRASLWPRRT
jgi:quinoprotein glucose dehydrogenase